MYIKFNGLINILFIEESIEQLGTLEKQLQNHQKQHQKRGLRFRPKPKHKPQPRPQPQLQPTFNENRKSIIIIKKQSLNNVNHGKSFHNCKSREFRQISYRNILVKF